MPKLPEFKSKPVKGVEDGDFSKWTLNRISAIESLHHANTPEGIAKRIANTDHKARIAKAVANTDYSKSTRGLKASVEASKKKVYVIKNNKHLATYDSILEASENLPVSFSSIQKILDPESTLVSARGYTFTTGEELDWSTVPVIKSQKQRGLEKSRELGITVIIYDIEGNELKRVPSYPDAVNYTGVVLSAIHSACKKPKKMWRRGTDGKKFMFEKLDN